MKRSTTWIATVGMFALTIVTAAPSFAQQSTSDEVALRTAMERETVRGDLEGAIEQYKKIAESKDRSIAARALLRMAESYRKLGDAEAQKIYQRIVSQYSDQKDALTIASTHLNDPRPAASDLVRRRIWSGPDLQEASWLGRVSPDGRYLSFTSEPGNDLMVRDLSTGVNRMIARTGGGTVEFGWWSPDSRRLAFRATQDGSEIRTINFDGTGERTLLHSADRGELWVGGWSADGEEVLVFSDFDTQQDRFRLLWLSVGDSSTQAITTATRRNGPGAAWVSTAVALSPDGRHIAFTGLTDVGAGIHLIASDGTGDTLISANSADYGALGWSPDGRYLLVASTRTTSPGLWAFPVAKGKPSGNPMLLQRDFADANVKGSLGVTNSGSLYYTLTNATREVWAIENFLPATK